MFSSAKIGGPRPPGHQRQPALPPLHRVSSTPLDRLVEQLDRAGLGRIAPQQADLLQVGEVRMHRRRRGEARPPCRCRAPSAGTRGAAEYFLMKSKISCWRFVRSLPISMRLAAPRVGRTCVREGGGGRTESRSHAPRRGLYCASPRADGGIGRRARLRAWSGITGWRFESSSAHRTKSPHSRGFWRSQPSGDHGPPASAADRRPRPPQPQRRSAPPVSAGSRRCPR